MLDQNACTCACRSGEKLIVLFLLAFLRKEAYNPHSKTVIQAAKNGKSSKTSGSNVEPQDPVDHERHRNCSLARFRRHLSFKIPSSYRSSVLFSPILNKVQFSKESISLPLAYWMLGLRQFASIVGFGFYGIITRVKRRSGRCRSRVRSARH